MNDLLKKIYNNVLVYEKDTILLNTEIDNEINMLIKPYADTLNTDEIEQYKNILSSIALTAEQTGFELGVRFILSILCPTID